MIKVIPAELHLLALLNHPDRLDNAVVRSMMEENGHYCPTDHELDQRRCRRITPPDFNPYNTRHEPSMQWLRQYRIYSLFHPDRSVTQAFKLLSAPPVRLLLEVCLILQVTEESIIKALRQQFSFDCTREAIVKYRHFFFDVLALDRLDLVQVLQLSNSYWQLSPDKEITPMHIAAEKRSLYRDPRIIVAENPTSIYARQQALALCGIVLKGAINHLPVIMKECLNAVAGRVGEAALSRAPNAAKDAAHWADTFRVIWDAQLAMQSPDDPLLEDFNRELHMEADTAVLPTVHQLTLGAQRTIDLQPTPKPEAAAADVRDADFTEGLFGGPAASADVGDDDDDTDYHD